MIKGSVETPEASTQSTAEAFRELLRFSAQRRWRACVLISGTRESNLRRTRELLEQLPGAEQHWYSDQPPAGVASSHGASALRRLGSEFDALIYDAWSGFDPDAFGALSGSLRAGGVLLLLTPALDEWPHFADPQYERICVYPYHPAQIRGRYLRRLCRLIESEPAFLSIAQDGGYRIPDLPVREAGIAQHAPGFPFATGDQQRATEAVIKVASGHRRRPVVLVSDRGRGKSAAFGIAAARLIESGKGNVIVTGPNAAAVSAVLSHARNLLDAARHDRIHFIAPDELLRSEPPADLVLVDEAAAIPAPLLEGLLKRYARIAFATTEHGYEGTGRGFAVRFNHILDARSNRWRRLELHTPVRWAPQDPLERVAFRLLLMNASALAVESLPDDVASLEITELDRDRLTKDEQPLRELFGLLVLAHYRTRPLDLRHLLDGPNVAVYCAHRAGRIAATVLIAEEGGFDAAQADSICAGETRPHGHLLPEGLAVYQGICAAPRLRCARVLRIAVHPALRRQGVATRMIGYVAQQVRASGIDYFGASFGATADLIHFWRSLGWLPVRVGHRRGASSGCHSVTLLAGLSDAGDRLLVQARQAFLDQFPHQLSDSLNDLEAPLVAALLFDGECAAPPLPVATDWREASAFVAGARFFEACSGSLWRVLLYAGRRTPLTDVLPAMELNLVIKRALQHHDWTSCAQDCGLRGHAEAQTVLRRAVAKLIAYHGQDPTVA